MIIATRRASLRTTARAVAAFVFFGLLCAAWLTPALGVTPARSEALWAEPLASPADAFVRIGQLSTQIPSHQSDGVRLAALHWQLEERASPRTGLAPRTLRGLLAEGADMKRRDALPGLWADQFAQVAELRVLAAPQAPAFAPGQRNTLLVPHLVAVQGSGQPPKLIAIVELINRLSVPISLPDFELTIQGATDQQTGRIALQCREWPQAPSTTASLRPLPQLVPPGQGVGYACELLTLVSEAKALLRELPAVCAASRCRARPAHFSSAARTRELLDAIASADAPLRLPAAVEADNAASPKQPPGVWERLSLWEKLLFVLLCAGSFYLSSWRASGYSRTHGLRNALRDLLDTAWMVAVAAAVAVGAPVLMFKVYDIQIFVVALVVAGASFWGTLIALAAVTGHLRYDPLGRKPPSNY